jgi:hypothetical protein
MRGTSVLFPDPHSGSPPLHIEFDVNLGRVACAAAAVVAVGAAAAFNIHSKSFGNSEYKSASGYPDVVSRAYVTTNGVEFYRATLNKQEVVIVNLGTRQERSLDAGSPEAQKLMSAVPRGAKNDASARSLDVK